MLEILLQSMGITTSILQESTTDILKEGVGPIGGDLVGCLLLETGDKLLLEDGLGCLLLE